MIAAGFLPAAEIKVGEHHTAQWLGLTWNVDTIYCTVIAGVIVCGLGLLVARQATDGVPGKLQLFWEMVVDTTKKQVENTIGPQASFVVPLAVSLFLFILIANWIEIIPSSDGEYLKSPTADVNLPYALALTVIIWVHVVALRRRGFAYVRGFFKPIGQAPIKVIEEVVKPVTLSLRLFGNLFSGGIMIALIGLLPVAVVPFGDLLWKPFDMAIGVIQAFIFALLTVLYFTFALSEEGH
ncbi:MAG: F-type H+-transporting ATPase subunit a [Frankiales bacterium]|nr:F-type H+-transporting ATPase subunit a [Frankiales bacterium]